MNASEKVEITEKEENKRQNEVVLPLTSRRLVSILVDVFLCFITFMILQTFAIPPLVGAITNIDQIAEAYQNRLVESHLYQRVSGGTMKITGTLTEEEKKKDMDAYFTKLDKEITFFYVDFTNIEEAKIENYYQSKEESGLFEKIGDTWEIKGSATFNELNQFYEEQYDIALNYFSHDDECLTLARKITVVSILEVFLSLTISIVIFFLIFPLIFKERQTLGKKLMGLAVVSRKDGIVAKRRHYLMRFLAFYVIEILLTVFTFGIPLIVSVSMLFFSKEKITLHDYLSATLVIDTRQRPAMHSAEELNGYEEQKKKISKSA